MGVFAEAAQRSKEVLEGLGEDADVFGVIHRDLKLDNVVFHQERAGVIDFDACGLGHYLLDLCRVRRTLTTRHANRLRPLWDAFLAGYENTRPSPRAIAGTSGRSPRCRRWRRSIGTSRCWRLGAPGRGRETRDSFRTLWVC